MVNNRWARLSQAEKAELLGIYTKYGYNDLARIIADYNTYADGGPENGEKPSLKKRLAYKLGSAAKEGAGLTIPGILDALVSPQREYDELDAYLNDPNKHFAQFTGEARGPLTGPKWDGIPQYKAQINPTGEYLFPEEWKDIIELAAKNGTTIYQNADKAFEYNPEYRFDAANYPMIIGRSDNGYVVNSADLYDFDKDYADRYTKKNKPFKRALVKVEIGMMRGAGNPYIVREEGIPIRFIGNDASQEEKDLAHQTILGIGKGETGNEFDENTAIDKILNRMGLYTGASSEIIEEMPDYLRYGSGGKIHIKPENRGKFTALKKRTGHSASWFKAHGTPAQKKMATFALNARKWKHDDGGPIGVTPLGGDFLEYLQTTPEVYLGQIEPSVATAKLPSKFNGSQTAAQRYAEGYLKGAKPVSEAMNQAGQDIFNTAKNVAMFVPGPTGLITWTGQMGADAANGQWGKVGRDLGLAAAIGLGAGAVGKGVNYLRNYIDEATSFGEDIFKAISSSTPESVFANTTRAIPAVKKTAPAAYQIADLGGGYMLKSLMRGNPLEKQLSKSGTISTNSIKALAGKSSNVDKTVIEKVLSDERFVGKKQIDYNDFRKAVQDELITYERTPNIKWQKYGMNRLGVSKFRDNASDIQNAIENYINEHDLEIIGIRPNGSPLYRDNTLGREIGYDELYRMAQTGELDLGSVPIPETYTFSSPRIPVGSDKHFDPNTLGHSRTYTTSNELDVLHVMESQSDWAQGGIAKNKSNLLETAEDIRDIEASLKKGEDIYTGDKLDDYARGVYEKVLKNKKDELGVNTIEQLRSNFQQQIYNSENFTSRQIQENLRYAAEKGQKKMRYPTRETAAKIEGYPEREAYFNAKGEDVTKEKVYTYGEKEDARLEEIDKELRRIENERNTNYWQRYPESRDEIRKRDDELYPELVGEQLRIRSSEPHLKPGITKKTVYDYEDILRKYTEFPKQFKKLFKGADVRTITDPKGNTWYEVDVPENYLKQEWQYKYGGKLNQFANISSIF